MRVIWDSEEYDALWDKLYREYGFEPDHLGMAELFHCAKQFTVFHLPENVWDEAQEKAVNDIFKRLDTQGMYALDWHHLAFEFSPREEIPYCQPVTDGKGRYMGDFPSYYPNGDYYFFIEKNWSFGMFGHPWRKEIYGIGGPLIKELKNASSLLGFTGIRRYPWWRQYGLRFRKKR